MMNQTEGQTQDVQMQQDVQIEYKDEEVNQETTNNK